MKRFDATVTAKKPKTRVEPPNLHLDSAEEIKRLNAARRTASFAPLKQQTTMTAFFKKDGK